MVLMLCEFHGDEKNFEKFCRRFIEFSGKNVLIEIIANLELSSQNCVQTFNKIKEPLGFNLPRKRVSEFIRILFLRTKFFIFHKSSSIDLPRNLYVFPDVQKSF